jgi:hypothetical protein
VDLALPLSDSLALARRQRVTWTNTTQPKPRSVYGGIFGWAGTQTTAIARGYDTFVISAAILVAISICLFAVVVLREVRPQADRQTAKPKTVSATTLLTKKAADGCQQPMHVVTISI